MMDEKERQLMDIMACDLHTARNTLQRCGGDLDRALDALMSTSAPSEQSAVVPYISPVEGPSTTPASSQPKLIEESQQDSSWADKASEGLRRNAKKRASPVDLTGDDDDDDDDDDLRKAMQASLESESSRQKRQQDFGLGGSANAQGISEDDKALTRAIEASMLQSQAPTRDQSPLSALQLDGLGAKQMRDPKRPVAVLTSTQNLKLFALALQAFYASEPLRRALLAIRFADIRVRHASAQSMAEYWKGESPAGIRSIGTEQWNASGIQAYQQETVDGAMRLMTMFAYMAYTRRSLVVADDVIIHSTLRNNYAYVMNSERKPSQDIMACYTQGLLEALNLMSTHVEEASSELCDAASFKRAYQSFTVNAVTPQSDDDPTAIRQPSGEPYEVVVHSLQRSNVNNTVHRALYTCLADEKALYSTPAETLLFCLGRIGQYNPNVGMAWEPEKGGAPEAPFSLEPRIYLDGFTFARRNGVRLGLDTDELKQRQQRIDELERYKKSISISQGDDTRAMLKASIAYFQNLCADDGSDALRTSSIGEAGPRLEAILAHLGAEIAHVEHQLQLERQAIDHAQSSTMAAFEQQLAQPAFQTMPYDLQAVLYEDGESAWAYVRHRDDLHSLSDQAAASLSPWWRICDGVTEQVSEEQVLGDGHTIFFMVYTASECHASVDDLSVSPASAGRSGVDLGEETGGKPSKSMRLDSSRLWWSKQVLIEAIEHDNAQFGVQLATTMDQQRDLPSTHATEATPSRASTLDFS